ncbi:MAG: hypothetical protein B6U76_02415 [Desulfurococcales archaeon ex4484_217_2]|nr:MAG: hypothetical protein B6U76_02415 [Desulfurococcales archaeon ex4484_217_2]
MRVLHIWNTAGVASILAKYQRKLLGWDTWVIMRKKYDKYGVTTYGALYNCDTISFYIIAMALASKYDIIHVHSLDRIVLVIKKVYKKKPVILHYHGSDIRGLWDKKKRYWSKADKIIVATEDLLKDAPPNATFLPNPVDTEIFKPMPKLRRKKWALFIYSSEKKHRVSLSWAKEIAKSLKLKLYILNRETKPIPYKAMPHILNRFEYFIDHRYVEALSKTALEALACGLKVIRWDKKILNTLPHVHYPQRIIKELTNIYYEASSREHKSF